MSNTPLHHVRLQGASLLLLGLTAAACADLGTHQQDHAPVAPPPLHAPAAVQLDGLHNVVTYASDMICGGVPEGREGLQTLAAMGVKTIVSVDGATPDVATAEALGMRYVHLPISYNGVEAARQKELAQAIANLPGPTYVHCHHGKHRSAAAMGSALVLMGKLTEVEAEERMHVSGTSADYPGLWQAVRAARPLPAAELVADAARFPSVATVSGMVATMSEIDAVFDNVKQAQGAKWTTPDDHPDLVPAKEARRLAHLFAQLADDPESQKHPQGYQDALQQSITAAKGLDAAVQAMNLALADQHYEALRKGCKTCHKAYRDQ